MTLRLAEHNLLLGGEPGAGKSTALQLVVAAAALDPATKLTLFDGKQVELAAWSDCAERFCGPDMTEAAEVLGDLQAEMDSRYEELLVAGRRKVTPDEAPLHVVVIDELALYLRSGTRDERAVVTERVRDLVSRGRVAREGGIGLRQAGEVFRLSYVKVVEFQRRGLAHVHAVVRGDGPGGPGSPPPAWLDEKALSAAIERAPNGPPSHPAPVAGSAGGASSPSGSSPATTRPWWRWPPTWPGTPRSRPTTTACSPVPGPLGRRPRASGGLGAPGRAGAHGLAPRKRVGRGGPAPAGPRPQLRLPRPLRHQEHPGREEFPLDIACSIGTETRGARWEPPPAGAASWSRQWMSTVESVRSAVRSRRR